MFDIRNHGGIFGGSKYKKNSFINISDLSYPDKYTSKSIHPVPSGYSVRVLTKIDSFLYCVTTYNNTHYLYKYLLSEDGIGSISKTAIVSNSINNSYTPYGIIDLPNSNSLLYASGPVVYKISKTTLAIESTLLSLSETIIGLKQISIDKFIVIQNSSNNAQKTAALYDFTGKLILSKTIFSTYAPLILPDNKLAYTNSSSEKFVFDFEKNVETSMKNVSFVGSAGYYGVNSQSFGLVFGDVFVVPYQSKLYFYRYVNGELSDIANINPFNNSYDIAGIIKLDEKTIYAITFNSEVLIDVNTKIVSPPKKTLTTSGTSNGYKAFLALDFDKIGKTFLYESGLDIFCPIFKTKILQ